MTATRRKETPLPLVLLALAGGVLLSPVLIPIAAWQIRRTERRRTAAALRFPCEKCGQLLGQAALDRANAEWKVTVEKLRLEHPNTLFRLLRTVQATCVSCHQEYSYDEAADTFRPVKQPRQRLSPALEQGA